MLTEKTARNICIISVVGGVIGLLSGLIFLGTFLIGGSIASFKHWMMLKSSAEPA
jgi:hypothetical protein